MNCNDVRDSLEMYIAGDLPDEDSRHVADHLGRCAECSAAYETTRLLVGDLKLLGTSFAPREHFELAAETAAARSGGSNRDAPGPATRAWRFAFAAALILAAVPATALAIPGLARRIPALPIAREIDNLESDVARLADDNRRLESQVESLTIQLKEIDGEKVPVVDSSEENLPPEDEYAIQKLAMDFVRAQYARDLDALARMGTSKLKADLAAHPNDYLREDGEFVFAQMTTVGIVEEGTYVVFIRLNDSVDFPETQYQEDFEIRKVDGAYLVDFVGMDA